MKQGGELRLPNARPNDSDNAVVMLEGDDEEFEQLNKDHMRKVQQCVVDYEAMHVVGGNEDAIAKETMDGAIAAR